MAIIFLIDYGYSLFDVWSFKVKLLIDFHRGNKKN